ncbi:MAG: hypothetical protein KUG75_07625, partial [Pseudomonadales bacterium]|nr:hypothetical protein [Pseudomonadales bacterium]
INDYLQILKRRKFYFAVPFTLIVLIAVAIAFLSPAVYRSEATLMVERQSIPTELVPTTVTSYVQEQIQQIRQRLVTPTNLSEIAEKFHLYPSEFDKDPISAAELIRENIEVDMVEVNATDPRQRGTRVTAIAFTVAYNSNTPESARAVTAEIAQRYLDESKIRRIADTETASAFLETETERQRAELLRLETLLADFKQEQINQLPELIATNMRLYEKAELDIDRTEQRIRGYQDRLDADNAELSLTQPYKDVKTEKGEVILSANERLSVLTAQYLRATARYSSEHPDIIRMSREIIVLAEQTGDAGRVDEIMNALVKLQEELRQARQQYSEEHPEVQKLVIAVAAMQKGFQTILISANAENSELAVPPDNPRYVALKTQIESTKSNLQAEMQELISLNEKLKEYEQRIFQTPIVERNFKSLSRDYDNANQKFRELKEKQLQANMATVLERGDSAAGFILASSAYLPVLPDSPNRIGIMLLGMMFAFAAGLGAIAIVEYLDKTIRDGRIITTTLGAPPLAVIPQM